MTVSVVCAFSPFHARKKPPLAFTSGRLDAKIQFFFESRHFRPLFKPSPTPTRLKRTRTTTLPMEEVSSHGDELDTSTRSGYILRFHRKFRPFRHRSRSSRRLVLSDGINAGMLKGACINFIFMNLTAVFGTSGWRDLVSNNQVALIGEVMSLLNISTTQNQKKRKKRKGNNGQ